MPIFSNPPLETVLNRHRDLLDQAFGAGDYDITSEGQDRVSVTTNLVQMSFCRERDGEILSSVRLKEPSAVAEGEVSSWLWARFLGMKVPARRRDGKGWVRSSPDAQLSAEIELVEHLQREIFSHPQILRDAVFYIKGYTAAYTDRASGDF